MSDVLATNAVEDDDRHELMEPGDKSLRAGRLAWLCDVAETVLVNLSVVLYLATTIIFQEGELPNVLAKVLLALVLIAHVIIGRRLFVNGLLVAFAVFWGLCVASLGWTLFPLASAMRVLTLSYLLICTIAIVQLVKGNPALIRLCIYTFVLATLVSGFVLFVMQGVTFSDNRFSEGSISSGQISISSGFAGLMSLYLARHQRVKWPWLVSFALFLAFIVLSSGRRGLFILVIATVLYLVLDARSQTSALGAMAGALLFMTTFYLISMDNAVLYDYIGHRLEAFGKLLVSGQTETEASIGGRVVLIDYGMMLFERSPLIGRGIDAFTQSFQTLHGSWATSADNNYVELLADFGIVGLLVYYVPMYLFVLRKALLLRTLGPGARMALSGLMTMCILDSTTVWVFSKIGIIAITLFYLLLTDDTEVTSSTAHEATASSPPAPTSPVMALVSAPPARFGRAPTWNTWRVRLFNKVWFAVRMPLLCKSWDDERYLRLLYWGRFGRRLDLEAPRTYSEKIQWLKIHDRNPLYTRLADKLAVKQWVAERIGEEHVIPTLGAWDSFDEIDFDALPQSFVLKATNDSGGIVLVPDKSSLDHEAARRTLEFSLRSNFYYLNREWPYKNVSPRIMAEHYMDFGMNEEAGKPRGALDYKVFCFDGETKAVLVVSNREVAECVDVFDTSWNHLPFSNGKPNAATVPERPEHLDEILRLARILSAGLTHVRVDFYDYAGRVLFGEMTLYHWGGLEAFDPPIYDELFGSWLTLPRMGEAVTPAVTGGDAA